MSVLVADDLAIGYIDRGQRKVVAKNIATGLHQGEFVCLLGPNGTGKSTLLRTLMGTQPALGGRVLLDGADIQRLSARERAQRMSVVLTEPVDAGMLTAYDLVALGRSPRNGWLGQLGDDDREVISWSLEVTGSASLAHRQAGELSDGERQRVMIARALAQEPAVLLLDEPTAFLDLTWRVELISVLRRLADTTGLAVLLSTHDLDLAIRTADSIWLIDRRVGFSHGSPEDLAHAGLIGSAYEAPGVIFDHGAGTFVLASRHHARAYLPGTDQAAAWGRRALERAGFEVVAADGSCDVTCSMQSNGSAGPEWHIKGASGTRSGIGYAALVVAARELVPKKGAGES